MKNTFMGVLVRSFCEIFTPFSLSEMMEMLLGKILSDKKETKKLQEIAKKI